MTSIVFHSGCADGIVAKEMMRSSAQYLNYSHIEFVPFQYGSQVTRRHLIKGIWVDCCPESEEDFLYGLENHSIYIDHHETVKNKFQKYFSKFPDQLIFGETCFGKSGASLTYDYLMNRFSARNVDPADIRDFNNIYYYIQKLAALADTWQVDNNDFKKARAMSSLIAMVGNEINIPECHLGLLNMAIAFDKNKQQQDARKAENINVMTFSTDRINLNVAILNDNHISDIAEILRNREENHADLIVGFFYIPDGKTFKVVYSLRSNDTFDCSKYAKVNGGGGHLKAAGFTVNKGSEFNPIDYFTKNLQDYLNTLS